MILVKIQTSIKKMDQNNLKLFIFAQFRYFHYIPSENSEYYLQLSKKLNFWTIKCISESEIQPHHRAMYKKLLANSKGTDQAAHSAQPDQYLYYLPERLLDTVDINDISNNPLIDLTF